MGLPPHLQLHKTAFDPETGLYLPIVHLLGNRIGLYNEGHSYPLNISFWQGGKIAGMYKGRVHISPSVAEELMLIEDFQRDQGTPETYPQICERTTDSRLVNLSLYYPLSQEIWNLRIHYKFEGLISDSEAEVLLAEGRVRGAFNSNFNFTDTEKVVYSPPRKVEHS